MIRINLLPVREARRKADARQQVVVMGGALLGAVLLALLFHQTVRSDISEARQQLAQLKTQLAQFKPQEDQVEAFKKKKADIEQKLGVIERLERSRSGPVHILDELATHIPERVWLTGLTADNGLIELNGLSLDNELVALFLTSLNDSPYFTNVELEETELKEVDELKLNTFRIQAQLDTPVEEAAPAPLPPGVGRAPGTRG